MQEHETKARPTDQRRMERRAPSHDPADQGPSRTAVFPVDDVTLGGSDAQRAAVSDAVLRVHAAIGGAGRGAPVQRRQEPGQAPTATDVRATAARGVGGSGTSLPHAARIQAAFGRHAVGHVRAHLGPEAQQASRTIGASAYAMGESVAFRGAPDLHTAAHEAAHVVQQRAGVALSGGVGQVGDRYERHADQVAAAVVRGADASALLDQMAGPPTSTAGAGAVQRTEQEPEEAPTAESATDNEVAESPAKQAVRDGEAGVADELRAKFSKGMTMSMVIPSAGSATKPEDVEEVAGLLANYESAAKIKANNDATKMVDPHGFATTFHAWAPQHEDVIGWKEHKAADAPETYAEATDGQKRAFLTALTKDEDRWGTVRAAMVGPADAPDQAMRTKIAKAALTNSAEIQRAAGSWAKRHAAVSPRGDGLELGVATEYGTKGEFVERINTAASRAKRILADNPPEVATPDPPTRDDVTSKVRTLTISSHGIPTALIGHGRAGDSGITNKDVPQLVADIASVLTSDVRVRVFACLTAAETMVRPKAEKGSKEKPPPEDVSFANTLRNALAASDKKEGAVIGHEASGHSTTNRKTRFLPTAEANGPKNEWTYGKVFSDGLLADLLDNVAERSSGTVDLGATLRRFFGEECWLDGDLHDAAKFAEECRTKLVDAVKNKWLRVIRKEGLPCSVDDLPAAPGQGGK